jgi:DNA-binding transcriptional MerR regulator
MKPSTIGISTPYLLKLPTKATAALPNQLINLLKQNSKLRDSIIEHLLIHKINNLENKFTRQQAEESLKNILAKHNIPLSAINFEELIQLSAMNFQQLVSELKIANSSLADEKACLAGSSYSGEFKGGSRYEFGTYTYPDGISYEGQWQAGKRHGPGVLIYPDGVRYQGKFAHDVQHGIGTYTFPDGVEHTVEFQNGKLTMKIITLYPSGYKYKGEYQGWLPHGNGVLLYKDGSKYQGQFKQAKRHGRATFYHADGSIYGQEWIEDKLYSNRLLWLPKDNARIDEKDLKLIRNAQSQFQVDNYNTYFNTAFSYVSNGQDSQAVDYFGQLNDPKLVQQILMDLSNQLVVNFSFTHTLLVVKERLSKAHISTSCSTHLSTQGSTSIKATEERHKFRKTANAQLVETKHVSLHQQAIAATDTSLPSKRRKLNGTVLSNRKVDERICDNQTDDELNLIVKKINSELKKFNIPSINARFFSSIYKGRNLRGKLIAKVSQLSTKSEMEEDSLIARYIKFMYNLGFDLKNISKLVSYTGNSIDKAIQELFNYTAPLLQLGFDAISISSMLSRAGARIGEACRQLLQYAPQLLQLGFEAKDISAILSCTGSKFGEACKQLLQYAPQLLQLGFEAKDISAILSCTRSKFGEACKQLLQYAPQLLQLIDAKSISSVLQHKGAKIEETIRLLIEDLTSNPLTSV